MFWRKLIYAMYAAFISPWDLQTKNILCKGFHDTQYRQQATFNRTSTSYHIISLSSFCMVGQKFIYAPYAGFICPWHLLLKYIVWYIFPGTHYTHNLTHRGQSIINSSLRVALRATFDIHIRAVRDLHPSFRLWIENFGISDYYGIRTVRSYQPLHETAPISI